MNTEQSEIQSNRLQETVQQAEHNFAVIAKYLKDPMVKDQATEEIADSLSIEPKKAEHIVNSVSSLVNVIMPEEDEGKSPLLVKKAFDIGRERKQGNSENWDALSADEKTSIEAIWKLAGIVGSQIEIPDELAFAYCYSLFIRTERLILHEVPENSADEVEKEEVKHKQAEDEQAVEKLEPESTEQATNQELIKELDRIINENFPLIEPPEDREGQLHLSQDTATALRTIRQALLDTLNQASPDNIGDLQALQSGLYTIKDLLYVSICQASSIDGVSGTIARDSFDDKIKFQYTDHSGKGIILEWGKNGSNPQARWSHEPDNLMRQADFLETQLPNQSQKPIELDYLLQQATGDLEYSLALEQGENRIFFDNHESEPAEMTINDQFACNGNVIRFKKDATSIDWAVCTTEQVKPLPKQEPEPINREVVISPEQSLDGKTEVGISSDEHGQKIIVNGETWDMQPATDIKQVATSKDGQVAAEIWYEKNGKSFCGIYVDGEHWHQPYSSIRQMQFNPHDNSLIVIGKLLESNTTRIVVNNEPWEQDYQEVIGEVRTEDNNKYSAAIVAKATTGPYRLIVNGEYVEDVFSSESGPEISETTANQITVITFESKKSIKRQFTIE